MERGLNTLKPFPLRRLPREGGDPECGLQVERNSLGPSPRRRGLRGEGGRGWGPLFRFRHHF